MKTFSPAIITAFLLLQMSGGAAPPPASADSATYFIPAMVEVDSKGVFLDQLIRPADGSRMPHLQIGPAPAFGKSDAVTRVRLSSIIREQASTLLPDNWLGADAVRISRRARSVDEAELQALLTSQIQADHIGEDGRLEIEFARPWSTITIPDEPMNLKLSPLPATGISSYLTLRFTIEAGGERFGPWQVPVRTRVWVDVWVASRRLNRGNLLTPADLRMQPLDSLRFRNRFEFPPNDAPIELMQDLVKGTPITDRHVKLRALVKRRQVIDATYRNGAISINMKVEVLEDGVGGQTIRVRNIASRRVLYARVIQEGVVRISG